MHPAIIPAALVLAIASMMAGVVLLRAEKTQLHWRLVALLLAIVVWTAGTLLRFSVNTQVGLEASLWFVFAGVFWAPPLWLLLAAHYARVPLFQRAPWVPWVVLAPSAVAYLALLTNDHHGWVLREVSFEALRQGGTAWGGPIFWVFIVWAYVCVLAGAAAYGASARRLMSGVGRRRGMLLALASVFPVAGSAVYLFQAVPIEFDLTPSSLTISLLLMYFAVFRYQLLEGLPLARRDVIDHLPEAVLIAAADGTIIDWNAAARELLGRDPEDLRGEPLGHVLASLAEAPGDLLDGLDRLPGGDPRVFEAITPDARSIEISVAGVRDADGSLVGAFAVLRDRTDERRFEALVRRSQKLESVSTLASGIAHEVNNPLAFIHSNLSRMLEMAERIESAGESGPDAKLAEDLAELRPMAEETLDGVARIERIVSGMRQIAAGRVQEPRPVDVAALVDEAVRLSNLGRDPAVDLVTRIEPDLPVLHGLPERLVQLVLNLLVNAGQALGPGGGAVCIEVAAVDDDVEIRVTDDGPGVPEEIRERIFDPFFTTKDPNEGTGLGLAIACEVARDHGGMLDLRARFGEGACFVARLPAGRG